MKKQTLALWALALGLLTSCSSSKRPDLGDGLFAEINTSMGTVIFALEQEKTPVTVASFVSLAEGDNPYVSETYKNKKFYDGLTFHRVALLGANFIIQGGDPEGTGMGGPGYQFKDEIDATLSHNDKGILSMANAGAGTNGSQFFITAGETAFLDGRHTVFGKAVEGLAVIDSMALVKRDPSDKPVSPLVLKSVVIHRNGKAAKSFDAVTVLKNYFDGIKEQEAALQKAKEALSAEFKSQKSSALVTDSGLGVVVLQEGEGPVPTEGSFAKVLYAGYFEDGGVFDTNMEDIATKFGTFDAQRKEMGGYNAIPMPYSQDARLISGFKEALLRMKVGDKIRVFVPPHLGYGEAGAGNVIPPSANLVFDLEITGVEK